MKTTKLNQIKVGVFVILLRINQKKKRLINKKLARQLALYVGRLRGKSTTLPPLIPINYIINNSPEIMKATTTRAKSAPSLSINDFKN